MAWTRTSDRGTESSPFPVGDRLCCVEAMHVCTRQLLCGVSILGHSRNITGRLYNVLMCMLHEHRAVDLYVVKQLAVLLRHDDVVARHLTARCEWWTTAKVQVPKCRIPARRYGKLIRRCAPNVQHRRRLEHKCSCICRL